MQHKEAGEERASRISNTVSERQSQADAVMRQEPDGIPAMTETDRRCVVLVAKIELSRYHGTEL